MRVYVHVYTIIYFLNRLVMKLSIVAIIAYLWMIYFLGTLNAARSLYKNVLTAVRHGRIRTHTQLVYTANSLVRNGC